MMLYQYEDPGTEFPFVTSVHFGGEIDDSVCNEMVDWCVRMIGPDGCRSLIWKGGRGDAGCAFCFQNEQDRIWFTLRWQ